MNSKKTGHVISHTHWDREWRAPVWGSRLRLVKMFDELIERFERDPQYKAFLLDGQVIAIDDYIEMCPQNRPMIEKLIRRGKCRSGRGIICRMSFPFQVSV
jgi:alpha-mannosidase